MANCFECGIKLGWGSEKAEGENLKNAQKMVGFSDDVLDRMTNKDVLCMDCSNKWAKRHALEMYNYDKNRLSEKDFEVWRNMSETKEIVQEAERILAEQYSTSTASPTSEAAESTNSTLTKSKSTSNTTPTIQNTMDTIPADLLRALTSSKHDEFKAQWDKNGLVQFKNDKIAILKRMVGQQVQFIVAYDKITEEGYRLMAIDEGMTAEGSGFSAGTSAYFYFQKMDYVR